MRIPEGREAYVPIDDVNEEDKIAFTDGLDITVASGFY